ncbi:hypothetical protein BG004_007822 [Podila humilis]|nr:hypothetical protein BG004_007822 [Podila humilis]
MSSLIPAPRPLPPLQTSDPRSFYTIVVSGENFPVTLSAIQYDAPNFFTEVFLNQVREEYTTRIMYIDRNPDVFRDIIKHMQGYYVAARDEVHLENLMMDAHFFKLKRLITSLRQTMFVNVSGTLFKVARETILNDSPNFFALLEPFADRNLTPTFFCRNPDLFKDILSHLQGYEIHVRDRTHRNNLLKEARYFKLNNLISKLSLGTAAECYYSGFPTKPEERVKPEVTMLLKNIKFRHILVKGTREFAKPASKLGLGSSIMTDSNGETSTPTPTPAVATTTTTTTGGGGGGGRQSPSEQNIPSSSSPLQNQDINMHDNNNTSKEKILEHNQSLVQSPILQDILYKPIAEMTEPLALLIELSTIELFAIWPGSVGSSMLGDQHLLVYRDQDLACLKKICKQLHLQIPTMAANIVQLDPNIYFFLDGNGYKGHEELEPIVRKLALSSAKITPPGRALRLVLGKALVKLGCKSGQLVMTVVKAEGWSSNKEYNACRKYLTDDMRDVPTI